jgi:hypothetical protein
MCVLSCVKEKKQSQKKKEKKSSVCVNQYLEYHHSTKYTYRNKKQKITRTFIASFSIVFV